MNEFTGRSLATLAVGALFAACLIAGCGQSDTSGYREFTKISEKRADDRDGTTAADAPANAAQARDDAPTTQADGSPSPTADSPDETATADAAIPPVVKLKANGNGTASGETNGKADSELVAVAPAKVLSPAGAAAPDAQPVTDKPSSPEASPPRKVELLVKERDFTGEGPEGALRVSFDDIDLLKVLNMDPVSADAPELMPPWLKSLNGKRIRLRGFMFPPFLETGITTFLFARDNQICCFGRDPKPYDIMPVILRDGVTTDYIVNRPFDVVGIFRIAPRLNDDGTIMRLYRIEDAFVIEKLR